MSVQPKQDFFVYIDYTSGQFYILKIIEEFSKDFLSIKKSPRMKSLFVRNHAITNTVILEFYNFFFMLHNKKKFSVKYKSIGLWLHGKHTRYNVRINHQIKYDIDN